MNAPTLPITLPAGGPTITFGGATLTADTNTDTVTVSASAAAGSVGATLTVTATHASSTVSNPQISGTVTITGLSILGATVGLEGTLAYANGSTSVSLSGKLTDDVAIADGFVLRADSTVSVSTTDGLAVHGRATVGPAGSSVDVTVDGSIRNADDWSLTVASKDAQPISPVDGFQITPNVSGTIAKADGKVGFTLAGQIDAGWTVGAATLSVNKVVFSNQEPEKGGLNCAEEIGVKAGQLWLGVSGSLAVDSVGVAKVDAEGCVNLTSKAFSVATTVETDAKPGVGGISITKATLKVSKEAGGQPAVTAAATLDVAVPGRDDLTFPGQVSITADGAFIAGGSIDLDALKLGTDGSNGVLLFASKAVTGYDASALGVKNPVDLKQGVTVLLTYTASKEVNRALTALHLPTVDTFQASATLSSNGVSLKGSVVFGYQKGGAKLYGQEFAGGAAIYLDTLDLGIATNGSDVSLSVGGSAYLVLPSIYPGHPGSEVQLSLNGSIDVTAEAVTVDLGFDIAAQHGPWTDAFGIPDLTVSRIAGKFGVTITPADAGIPLPNFAIRVDNLKLPAAWGNAIGVVDGSLISLNLALNVTNPIVDVTIAGPKPGAIALRPFTIAKTVANSTPDSITHLVEVTKAHLLFAPLGGRDAANQPVSPGIAVVFDSYIDGRLLHVDAGVGLDPFPHLHADINIPGFQIGTVTIDNTKLAIDLDANPSKPVAKLVYSGGFTDRYTQIGFHADIDTGVTGQAAGAKATLTATAGLPDYFDSALTLSGGVSATSQGLILWGNGYAKLRINGQLVGGTGFSYSSDVGAGWAKLGSTFAQAYKDAYHWADWQVAAQLKALNFTAAQIATGVSFAFNEGVAAVTAALNRAGYAFNDAAAAVRSALIVADQQFANSLRAAGYGAAQIASVLHSVYGEGDRQVASVLKIAGAQVSEIVGALKAEFQSSGAALYNTLQSIGSAGQSALDAINSYFNTGAYNIWTYPPALAWTLGTSNGMVVTSWFNAWSYDQQWYVLPTDSGYAEIVNRGSGPA